MQNVFVNTHPLVQDSLTHLRNKNTGLQKFRHHSDKICQLLFADAINDLSLNCCSVETPIGPADCQKLVDEIIVVPVLRAGLAMLFGAMHLLPKSKICFVGLERDEKTAIAHEYYWKLPIIHKNSLVIVTDPMLATGGSISHLLKKVASKKPKEMRVVSVVSAPEGIESLHREFPKLKIFTAKIDHKLNKQKYIVPGIGDYGDRYFGTEGYNGA
jgi:uracil phosphoribosyltransferase